MKEIVIISGKGGTGKTSVAVALATVASRTVIADCDVDAADVHLIMKPVVEHREDFYSGIKAMIDPNLCISCGLCRKVCRFHAISKTDAAYKVDPLDCEGCGYCFHVCPVQAISLPEQNVGQCYVSQSKLKSSMVHARLGIGADNSGKLVAKVKKDARELASRTCMNYVLVDGSPGIGCPVISSLSGADYVLLVTEPTVSGLSDLQRVWQLTAQFQMPAGCIINKADLNIQIRDQIRDYLSQNGIKLIDELPYDEDFSQAITNGQSLVEYAPQKWQQRFTQIWSELTREIQ